MPLFFRLEASGVDVESEKNKFVDSSWLLMFVVSDKTIDKAEVFDEKLFCTSRNKA